MKPKHSIDIRGLCCSAPIIRLAKEFKSFVSGDIVLVVSDKSSMQKDIPAYCITTENRLLKEEVIEAEYHFWIQKG